MKKFFFTILTVLLCTSCSDNKVSMGDVKYYPSFLWIDEYLSPAKKTFEFDFSEDAQNDNNSFAEFQFLDNDGKAISTDVMQVSIDGTEAANNRFRISSNTKSATVTFRFSPDAPSGKHQGYLKLVSHNIDRLDNQPLAPGETADVFQWTLTYEKCMNPLAMGLMWLAIIIAACLATWFLLVKRFVYPRIRLQRIELKCDSLNYYENKRINSARLVVIGPKKDKQSWLNKLFTGKIVYIANENVWPKQWEIRPKGSKKVGRINLHGNYLVNPISSEFEILHEYTLINKDTKEKITIKL